MAASHRTLLAAAFKARGAYDDVAASGEAETFPDSLKPLWDATRSYYERDLEARSVDPAILAAQVSRSLANPKHADAARELVEGIAEDEVSVANVREYITATAADRIGHALATAIATRRPRDEVGALIQQYTDLDAPQGAEDGEVPWGGLLRSRLAREARVQVTPKVLNDRLHGGLLPGHNVIIFGRPESGKSALALTMACGFAKRGQRVLYVGNEDPVQDLMTRAIQNLTGASLAECEAHPDEVERSALSKGAGNLLFRELSPGSLTEIERLVRLYKPAVLVVDQLRNIKVAKTENFTQLLDKAAQGIRALGKRYKLITVCVTQAGDSARGKPVLDDGDIDSSNTGIPAAADVLIGIGRTDQLEAAGQRMLSICKNKVTGRHDHFTVRINASITRITSDG
jgi:archaellum biogenesis ATPase FlaH